MNKKKLKNVSLDNFLNNPEFYIQSCQLFSLNKLLKKIDEFTDNIFTLQGYSKNNESISLKLLNSISLSKFNTLRDKLLNLFIVILKFDKNSEDYNLELSGNILGRIKEKIKNNLIHLFSTKILNDEFINIKENTKSLSMQCSYDYQNLCVRIHAS